MPRCPTHPETETICPRCIGGMGARRADIARANGRLGGRKTRFLVKGKTVIEPVDTDQRAELIDQGWRPISRVDVERKGFRDMARRKKPKED